MCCRESQVPLTSFSARAATAVVASKPERWVPCSVFSTWGLTRFQPCQGEALLSPCVRQCIRTWEERRWVESRRRVREAAALGCPASLAELQLLTELLALLEPPPTPPSVQRPFLSSRCRRSPKLPDPISLLQ